MNQYGLTQEDKTFGMLCHLLSFAGFFVPLGNILGPLVIWLMKKDQSAFVNDQGKESLNFQISLFVYGVVGSIISVILMIVLIGFVLIILLGIGLAIFWIVLAITASIRANEGQAYRYPLTIRFLK